MPRPVSHLRRFANALAALLLLQLTLLGSGTLCAAHEMAGGGSASSHAMASMLGMAGHQSERGSVAAQHDGHGSPAAPPGCESEGGSHDCGLPWSSGACAAMTTCATVVAPPSVTVAEVQNATHAIELPEPTQLLTGPAAAPELPPPRA